MQRPREAPGGGEVRSFRRDGSEVSVRVSGRLRVRAAEGMRTAVLSVGVEADLEHAVRLAAEGGVRDGVTVGPELRHLLSPAAQRPAVAP
jgi:hypothetical protein